MSWFSRRPQGTESERLGEVEAGEFRSPGLAAACAELRDPAETSVLDLGPSSSESLEFFQRLAESVSVQDLFHRSSKLAGPRSGPFRFATGDDPELPEGETFTLVLVWDLLHCFAPRERRRFGERVEQLVAPGGVVLVTASATASVPPEPIHFRALAPDRLHYSLGDGARSAPGLYPRDIEQAFRGLRPLRSFQLRNGLQELVFRRARPGGSGVLRPVA